MRRRDRVVVLVVVCALAAGAWALWAARLAPTQADNAAGWRTLDDGAGVVHAADGELVLAPAPATDAAQARSAVAVLGSDATRGDYSYSVRLQTYPLADNAAPALVRLLVRYSPPAIGYYVAHSAAGLELGRLDGSRQVVLARSADPGAAPEGSHAYRVDARGATLRVFVDGVLWISYDDPRPILGGGAGIAVQGVQAVVTEAAVAALQGEEAGGQVARVSLGRSAAPVPGLLPTLAALLPTPAGQTQARPTAAEAAPTPAPTPLAPATLEGPVGWGSNAAGELGDPPGAPRLVPGFLTGLGSASALAAGGRHSLAVDASGSVWAWGSNASGQLGDGTTRDRADPRLVPDVDDVSSVAAGDDHSLALKADGTVWAWGANASGQLGDGTTEDRTRPVLVEGLEHVRRVAAGRAFSVALKADGTVWAWGANEAGQLGDGTNTSSPRPVRTRDLEDVESIAAGAYFGLARQSSGTVWAWGADEYGQLGQGAPSAGRNAPVPVSALGSTTAIAAGGYHALSVDASGSVWAWGANWFGQLGAPTADTCPHAGQSHPCSATPRPVPGLERSAVRVAAGEFHSLALAADGSVWAWGLNAEGELGEGTDHTSAGPVRVIGLGAASSIAAGGRHSLATSPAHHPSVAPAGEGAQP